MENDTDATTLRPKGRSRSQQKRELILQAAADLFTEQGFDTTSMDQIAERADVSKQTVYSHFGSKEGVFIASIERRCMVNSLSPDFFERDTPPQEMLLQLARSFTELLHSDEAIRVLRLCASNADSHPELSELFHDAGPANLQRLLSGYLQRQVEAGNLCIDNVEFAAHHFLFMVRSDSALRCELGVPAAWSADKLDDYLQSCVSVFLKAYAA